MTIRKIKMNPMTAVASSPRWWSLATDEQAALSVQDVVKMLQNAQGRRKQQNLQSAMLYGNSSIAGMFGGSSKSTPGAPGMNNRDRVTYNACKSAVDTVTSKIAKNKPLPIFLTSGGDYKIQRKAKKLSKFVEGIFYQNDAFALGAKVFRDGCVFDMGVVHVFDDSGTVRFERVLPLEILIDEIEGMHGKPRQCHRVKQVDRQVFVDAFPALADAAKNASQPSGEVNSPPIADLITVIESWHLPSSKDAKDGKHQITVGGDSFREEYEKDFFPFAVFQWSEKLTGWYGMGLIEEIQNLQKEMNKLLYTISRSIQLMGSFKVFLENGSKIVKSHIDNEIGSIITYNGKQPTYAVPPAVQPEIYQRFEALKSEIFEQAGISQLSAASKKPAGLDSGKALREFNDIESDRFQTVGQAYERFFLNLAKLAIECAKGIAEESGNYKVPVPGKKFTETISWKEIKLSEEQYTMKVYPTSSLPTEPAGRLATIQELIQAGFISPKVGAKLLDYPDLDQVEALENSQEELLNMILEKIVDGDGSDDDYTPPEEYDNLTRARELALQYYSEGRQNALEENKLELIRKFIAQIDALTAPPPQAQGALPPGPTPQAVAAPPPVSDLVPNAPGMAAAT